MPEIMSRLPKLDLWIPGRGEVIAAVCTTALPCGVRWRASAALGSDSFQTDTKLIRTLCKFTSSRNKRITKLSS